MAFGSGTILAIAFIIFRQGYLAIPLGDDTMRALGHFGFPSFYFGAYAYYEMIKFGLIYEDYLTESATFVAAGNNEPTALLAEVQSMELPEHLEFIQFPLAGFNTIDFTQFSETSNLTTFFMTPSLRQADPSRLHFLPMQMRSVYDYLKQGVDVVLFQVAYDQHGNLRLGPNVDFIEAALQSASVWIAELNHSVVAPVGSIPIDKGRIDYLFDSDRPLHQMPLLILIQQLRIGELVSVLIVDGSCIQTGIGAIPAAILSQLSDKNDLGMHGGLIDDAGRELIDLGVLSGKSKTIDNAKHVTGMALGTDKLYEWLAFQEDVVFRGGLHARG